MHQKLSFEDFIKSFEYAPRFALELIVEDSQGRLLLLKRENEPFKNEWHLPGGFLLKDEPIDECLERLISEELSLSSKPFHKEPLGVYETIYGDPRGHVIHHPIRIKLKEKIEVGKYFDRLPENTIYYQKDFLQELGYK